MSTDYLHMAITIQKQSNVSFYSGGDHHEGEMRLVRDSLVLHRRSQSHLRLVRGRGGRRQREGRVAAVWCNRRIGREASASAVDALRPTSSRNHCGGSGVTAMGEARPIVGGGVGASRWLGLKKKSLIPTAIVKVWNLPLLFHIWMILQFTKYPRNVRFYT